MTEGRRLVCVGSYTAEHGEGVTSFWQDPGSGRLARAGSLPLEAPSWLEWHPRLPLLYATNEVSNGAVTTIAVAPDATLRIVAERPTGAGGPCHLAISPDGRRLFASNYERGGLTVFELDAAGIPTTQGDVVDQPDAAAPTSHLHMAVVADDLVHAVDLGTDEIRTYQVTGAGRMQPRARLALPRGSGPRQLVRNPGARVAYVNCELSSTLLVLDEHQPGRFAMRSSRSATRVPMEPETNYPAQLTLSDGWLYLSQRGVDAITVFDVAGPDPVIAAEHPVGGRWPRHFAIAGRFMYVAAQRDDRVIAFEVDGPHLRMVADYAVGTPTCVAPAPRTPF